jgi:hypothetical protein
MTDEPGRARSSASFSSAATLVLVSALRVATRHSTMFEDAMMVKGQQSRASKSHNSVTDGNVGPLLLSSWWEDLDAIGDRNKLVESS